MLFTLKIVSVSTATLAHHPNFKITMVQHPSTNMALSREGSVKDHFCQGF
jgi:hypothetical protein